MGVKSEGTEEGREERKFTAMLRPEGGGRRGEGGEEVRAMGALNNMVIWPA